MGCVEAGMGGSYLSGAICSGQDVCEDTLQHSINNTNKCSELKALGFCTSKETTKKRLMEGYCRKTCDMCYKPTTGSPTTQAPVTQPPTTKAPETQAPTTKPPRLQQSVEKNRPLQR